MEDLKLTLGFKFFISGVPNLQFFILSLLKFFKMILKSKINQDFMKAFKERNSEVKSLLGTIKGEIQTQEKNSKVENLSDEEVIKILNKFAKNLKENIRLVNDPKSVNELTIVESYLPKLLSTEEIQSKIDDLVASGVKNIGMIMKEFSNLPVDKKVVSELVKKSII
jgi:uncharacterized protein YqeY